MSVQSTTTLQKLARQTLMRNEAVIMSSLEELPTVLFPALFKEAFEGSHNKLLKEMVATWPFPCFPVGALMKTPNLETLQAVLEGVDMRLTRNIHHRGKLQVLDLRNVHYTFWNIWADEEDGSCSSETLDDNPVVKVLPRYALRHKLKVVTELCLMPHLEKAQAYFLKWAQQRKGFLHFCCTKLKIWAMPMDFIREILNVFHPEHIEQLELNTEWNVFQLAHFAPFFGQMRNLCKLLLAPLYKNVFKIANRTGEREDKCVKGFISMFLKFNCLQHLSLSGVHFLRDHMNQVFDSFSCCQSLFHLKHLEMSSVTLSALDIMPLRSLMEKVADNLQTLDLQGCRMKDYQLNALLPALTRCSQLVKINFYNNDFSMAILKDFLHTANWGKINVEQPAPLECYDELAHVCRERFAQLCQELMDTLGTIRQLKSIPFATNMCHKCGKQCVYGRENRTCSCQL
uniref:PRAME like 36 like 1 n=1 Tax=Rattus norvegicus TaxID=10116 RepID=A0A8I6ACX9_RAT